ENGYLSRAGSAPLSGRGPPVPIPSVTLRKLVTKGSKLNQLSSSQNTSGTVTGPLLMLVAMLAFAGTNVLQSLLSTPAEYGGFGVASTGMTFWQYLVATVIALPLIARIGVKNLRTSHPVAHEIRAFVSALGVHVFV